MTISVKKSIDMQNSAALATIELTIDNQDYDIIGRSGPLSVDFGGDFSTAAAGDATESLKNNAKTVTTQTYKVSVKFGGRASAADNEQVALDWFTSVETKITTAIGNIRTADAALQSPGVTYANI